MGAVVEPPPRFATFKKHRKIITCCVDLCAVAFTEIPDVKFMQVFINVSTLMTFSHVMHTTISGGGGGTIRWGVRWWLQTIIKTTSFLMIANSKDDPLRCTHRQLCQTTQQQEPIRVSATRKPLCNPAAVFATMLLFWQSARLFFCQSCR